MLLRLGTKLYKANPYAVKSELRPGIASVTKDISNNYKWGDKAWISARSKSSSFDGAYEYIRNSHQLMEARDGSFYTYRELADRACSLC